MTRRINEREFRAQLNDLRRSPPPADGDGDTTAIASGEPIISLTAFSRHHWPNRTAAAYLDAPADAVPGPIYTTEELDERTRSICSGVSQVAACF